MWKTLPWQQIGQWSMWHKGSCTKESLFYFKQVDISESRTMSVYQTLSFSFRCVCMYTAFYYMYCMIRWIDWYVKQVSGDCLCIPCGTHFSVCLQVWEYVCEKGKCERVYPCVCVCEVEWVFVSACGSVCVVLLSRGHFCLFVGLCCLFRPFGGFA